MQLSPTKLLLRTLFYGGKNLNFQVAISTSNKYMLFVLVCCPEMWLLWGLLWTR